MAPKRKAEVVGGVSKDGRRRIEKEFLVHLEPGYCFTLGTNGFGALGLGEDVLEKFRATQVDVGDGKRVVQVACGGMHTAALAEDGTVYTFGVNDEGALGRPTSGTAWEAEPDSSKEDPTLSGLARLPAGTRIVQVAAGDGFTFALSDEGAIWGWGQFKDDLSSFYSFSPGTQLQRLPALVYLPASVRDRVRKLAAGARHMAALTRRGEVLTWGIAGQGQLGRVAAFNSSGEERPPAGELLVPRPVRGIAAAIGTTDIADIGCGSYATFAINKRGAVAAWGLNNGGQLGLPVAADADGSQSVWQPAAVPELDSGVAAISGGEHHSLALTKQHKVLSFGSSNYGMLGRSDIPKPHGTETICLPDPAPVDSSDGLSDEMPTGIAAGVHVSACVTRGGQLFTWGSNVNYQMAKGQDEDDNLVPTRMRRHKAFGNRRVLQFSFGGQHAALVASEDEAAAAAAPAAAPAAATAPAADVAGTSAAAAAEVAGTAAAAEEEAAVAEPEAQDQANAAEAEPAAASGKGKRGRAAAAGKKTAATAAAASEAAAAEGVPAAASGKGKGKRGRAAAAAAEEPAAKPPAKAAATKKRRT